MAKEYQQTARDNYSQLQDALSREQSQAKEYQTVRENYSLLEGALSREQSQAKEYQKEYHDALSRMQTQATEYQERFEEERKKTSSLESVVQSLQTDLLSVRNTMNEMKDTQQAPTKTLDKEELT